MKSNNTQFGSEIIPTVVPDSFEDIGSTRHQISTFASALHVDIADGLFAPNTTWLPRPGDVFPENTATTYEVHMMVEHPLSHGVLCAKAGAHRIIAHIEAFDNAEKARDTFTMWRLSGVKEVGLGVLMQTQLETLMPYISLCDEILLMTIARVGTQGIPFEEKSIERVREAHERFPRVRIAVDGGVSEKNIKALRAAGASRFSVGSAISRAPSPEGMFQALHKLVN